MSWMVGGQAEVSLRVVVAQPPVKRVIANAARAVMGRRMPRRLSGADGGAVGDALPAGLAEDAFAFGGGGFAQVVDLVLAGLTVAGPGVALEFVPLLWAGVLDFGETHI